MSDEHPHHQRRINWRSVFGVAVIIALCLGFVMALVLVVMIRAMPPMRAAHVEGTIEDFESRTQARDEGRRRVSLLMIKEPGVVTVTPPGGSEEFITFDFGASRMTLHLMPIQIHTGRWSVKWTADLQGTEARNLEIANAWKAAAGAPLK